MKTSLMFRSLASCLKVEVCSGLSTSTYKVASERERRGALGTRAAGAWGRSARLFLTPLWLGLVLLGGAVVCPLEAQTVKTVGQFGLPVGVAVDRNGNLYIASDSKYGGAVYEASGCASGNCVTTTLGGGFYNASGVAVDGSGNVYIADTENNAVKEMPPGCASASCVTTLGGRFKYPWGVAVDVNGNVYVADGKNNAVKEMPPRCASASCVATLGGGFNGQGGVAVDGSGNVYVSDTGNNAVKEMPAGCDSPACVTTLAAGVTDPAGIAVDVSGNIYLGGNNEVRVMAPGCTSTSCMTLPGCCFGDSNGVAVDLSGDIYVTGDEGLKEILPGGVNPAVPGGEILPPVSLGTVAVGATGPPMKLSFTFSAADSGITASVLTQGAKGLDFIDAGGGSCDTNGTGHAYNSGDTCTVKVKFAPRYAGPRYGAMVLSDAKGAIATAYIYGSGQGPQLVFGPATQTTLGGGFDSPAGLAVDGSGNVYVANSNSPSNDGGVNGVEEMPAGCASSSCVTSLGGGFSEPSGVAVDGSGNVYVADNFDGVKEMPPGCGSASCVTSLGGGFGYPAGVAVDGSGNVYVADSVNDAVKEMPPGCASSSCVTTLGGGFYFPFGVAVDGGGNVYVADTQDYELKVMPPGCTSSTCVTTLVGGGIAPDGVAVDGGGNVYVGDEYGTGVMELDAASPPSLSFGISNGTGVQSTDSPQTATLRNIGNAPLSFPVPLTGENPSGSANFTLDSSTTCPEVLTSGSAGTLAGGASCELAVDFIPPTTGAFSGAVVLTDNNLNASPVVTQSIGLSGTGAPAQIVPYVQVNGGAWQNVASVTVNYGDTVNLAPQPTSGGSWSWTGPNGFTSTAREINAVTLTSVTTVYEATYTDAGGVASTQAFTITVNPTPLKPEILVDEGAFLPISSVTVKATDTVSLSATGSGDDNARYMWTGPNGFTSSGYGEYLLSDVPLPLTTNTYVLTYINSIGLTSTQVFTITVSPNAIVPYIQDLEQNGGAWQQVSSLTVHYGDTVNLGPQPATGGTWSWIGPSGFTSTSRVISASPLTYDATNQDVPLVWTAAYTSPAGVIALQLFTIKVNPSPIFPYIEVNGGAWQNVTGVTVNYGDTVNLGPQPVSGGAWNWSGPGGFTSSSRQVNGVPLTLPSNVFTATYSNPVGVQSTQAFTITVNPTPITPYLEVNGGAWQGTNSVTVAAGSTVSLGPWPQTGGSWSWTGPNGFTSASREIDGVPLPLPSGVFTATYTNPAGVVSTEVFVVTVEPTPIIPYVQDYELDGGAWQNVSSLTVNYGDTVNFGPQPGSGSSWSWTGPGGFTANARQLNGIPLTLPSNVFTATYTNLSGAKSTQIFTITVNSTPIVPYLQVNSGTWQSVSEIAVDYGETVDLGPQPGSGGTWSWSGPGGFTSTLRAINGAPLASGYNVYTATYTNPAGVTSQEVFSIWVNPTPIVPYIEVNGGAWQATNSLTVGSGSAVNLGPQPGSGGTWSWSGPGGFTSTARQINGIPLSGGTNIYVATYTNPVGVKSVETFTITVE